ncbi:hypothetical protein QOZ80_2AG0111590 [Eleusine coracana subsp. coracana]|nr:hypothetical protein QOZ80_2AG0111590 [Eleusine coracana subsp. coracana]
MLLQLLLRPPAACATAAAAPVLAAFSRPRPSRVRGSHIPFAFPRLRKYGRRRPEPEAAPTFDDDDDESEAEEDEEDGVEEAVDEEEFLATRPKPVGFGEGKSYTTDIEEQLLRERGVGGARRKGEPAPAKLRAGSNSDKQTSADLNDCGVQVRIWNLPKKKNIHKDLKQAFKGFPGLLTINPAVSANKKTRDPICKGFAYLKMESVEAATRFVEIYSRKHVSFGKVEKPISCCVVDAQSSTEPFNKGSSSQEIQQSKSKHQNLVAAS